MSYCLISLKSDFRISIKITYIFSYMFTEEEHALADGIKDNASRLARFALANNEIGLMNELEILISNAISGRSPKRAGDPRRRSIRQREKGVRYESFDLENDDFLLEASYTPEILDRITNILASSGDKGNKSRLQLAQRMIKAYPKFEKCLIIFQSAINMIKRHLGLRESIDDNDLLIFEDDKKEKKPKKKLSSGPSKDRDIGEILYHLDMSTRHLDVLVDYTMVAGHEKDIVTISSSIQKLAHMFRRELGNLPSSQKFQQ